MLGRNLVFIDIFQFMSRILEKLVDNLLKEDLKYTSGIFKDKALEVMSQKGVYPFDNMDNFEKFNKTTFPSKEQFYSQLNNEQYLPTGNFKWLPPEQIKQLNNRKVSFVVNWYCCL